jgi:hypothetical protein
VEILGQIGREPNRRQKPKGSPGTSPDGQRARRRQRGSFNRPAKA